MTHEGADVWTAPVPTRSAAVLTRRPPTLYVAAGALAIALLTAGVVGLASFESTSISACDEEGPRLAEAMDRFLREHAAGVTFAPTEQEVCDSTPGVVVRLIAEGPDAGEATISRALDAAKCGTPTSDGDYEVRTCVLPSGRSFQAEVTREDGLLTVFGSLDL